MDPGVSLGARLSFRSETAGAFLRPTGFQDSRIGCPYFCVTIPFFRSAGSTDCIRPHIHYIIYCLLIN